MASPSSTAMPYLQSESAPLPAIPSGEQLRGEAVQTSAELTEQRFVDEAAGGEEEGRGNTSSINSGGGDDTNSNCNLPAPLQPNKPHRLQPQPLPQSFHQQQSPQSQQRRSLRRNVVSRTGAGQANKAHRLSSSTASSSSTSLEGCGTDTAEGSATATNDEPLTFFAPRLTRRRPSQESDNSTRPGIRRRPDGQVISSSRAAASPSPTNSSRSLPSQGNRLSEEGRPDCIQGLQRGDTVQAHQSAVSFVQVGSISYHVCLARE